MRRSYAVSGGGGGGGILDKCLFYAKLRDGVKEAQIAWDNDLSINKQSNVTISNNDLYLSGNSYILWNCKVPTDRNMTFCCWVKKVQSYGVSYNFGCGHTTLSTRYTGLNFCEYNYYLLMQEYMYFYRNPNLQNLLSTNQWVHIAWTIIFNGNSSYTIKFYKNGILNNSNTITNTSFKIANCVFEIGHGCSNTMVAYNKDFGVFEELTDSEIEGFYTNQNGALI